jgi:hypothetical protein
METEGEFYEEVKRGIAKAAGQEAADMLQAAIRFRITGVRPIVDMG